MKNYEVYEDKIREFKGGNFCRDFVIPHIFKSDNCDHMHCSDCGRHQLLWFMEDCEEPEVDWSKVAVDTPILVRMNEDEEWERRYFANYENGTVYAWQGGLTSWTTHWMTTRITEWNYAKLAENEEEDKEPKTDWSKVAVDTPILVRDSEDEEWRRRYFAKYENGTVYAWGSGRTSWSGSSMTVWNCVKLAESEEE